MFYHYELFNIATILFFQSKDMSGYSIRCVKNKWREEKEKRKEERNGQRVSLLVSMWQFKPGACLLCIWNQFEMWDYKDCLKDNRPTEDRKTFFFLANQAFLCSPFLQKLGIMSRNIQICALKCIMLLNHLFAQRHRAKAFPFLSVVVIPSLPFPPYGD